MHTNTFAGRMGRWSAQHRKKAIWGWIAFVVIAFAVGNAVGTKQPTHDDYVGQSGQAEKLFADHFAEKDSSRSSSRRPRAARRPTPPFARPSLKPSPPCRASPA